MVGDSRDDLGSALSARMASVLVVNDRNEQLCSSATVSVRQLQEIVALVRKTNAPQQTEGEEQTTETSTSV